MRIIFFNIAWMEYYKGDANGNDHPKGGGGYVEKNQYAHEEFNFHPVKLQPDVGTLYCLGFVETSQSNGLTNNQMNIERIPGCELYKSKNKVEDVTAVYCARYPWTDDNRETYVVGWYKHATVFRKYEAMDFNE